MRFRVPGGFIAQHAFTAGGETLLVGSDRYHQGRPMQAVDAATGEVADSEPVGAFALVGAAVFAVRAADPSTLGVYRAHDLSRMRTVPVGVPLDATGRGYRLLAAGGDTVAAACADPPTVAIVATADAAAGPTAGDGAGWPVRRVELPAKPSCVGVSDDGALVAVGTDQERSGRVLIVDAATGAVRHTLTGPRAPVHQVMVTGGRVVAAAGTRVLTWALPPAPPPGKAAPAGRAARTPAAPRAAVIAAAKKSAWLVGVTARGTVVVHRLEEGLVGVDPASGQEVWSDDSMAVEAVMNGDRLVVNRHRTIVEMAADTGAVLREWPDPAVGHVRAAVADRVAVVRGSQIAVLREPGVGPRFPAAHGDQVLAVSFDGERFATTGRDGRVFVWRRGQAEPSTVIDGQTPVWPGLGVHLDGDDVWTTFRHKVQHWHVDGSLRAESEWLKTTGTLVRPLPNGLLLVATETSRGGYGELCVLDAATLEILDRKRVERSLHDAVWADERHLELNGRLLTITFDVVTRQRTREHLYEPETQATEQHMLPDRSLVVGAGPALAADGTLSLGHLTVTALADGARHHLLSTTESFTGRGAALPNGPFATPHRDAIRLWNIETGTVMRELPAPPDIATLWWFPDGSALLVGTRGGALHEVPV